ncbi:MAG: acyltransferase [Pseudomonadota bacterium]
MRSNLDPLTSLRFFAALAIVFHHIEGVIWLERGVFHPYVLGNGVSFFFVLSGFVLHYSYADRMSEVGWHRFILMRFMRIWPAHVAVLALCGLWIVAPGFENQLRALSDWQEAQIWLLLHAWNSDRAVFWGLNGPSWSISAELFFYSCFPLMVLLLARLRWALFAVFAVVGTVLWLTFATQVLYDPENRFSALAFGYISPLAGVGEFCIGMTLSALLSSRLTTLPGQNRAMWTGAEIGSLVILVLVNGQVARVAHQMGLDLGPVVAAYVRSSGAFFAFALVIGIFAVGRGYLSQVLRHPALVWLGTVSFAMYLIHQPLLYHWRRVVAPVLEHTRAEVVGFSIALILLSAAVHRWVELPGITLGRRIAKALPDLPGRVVQPPEDDRTKTVAS